MSFDVKSVLVTSIPLQLALDCAENAIKNSILELPLPTDDIIAHYGPIQPLFDFDIYFQCRFVVANIFVKQNIEEQFSKP